jgi:hypothetical protein
MHQQPILFDFHGMIRTKWQCKCQFHPQIFPCATSRALYEPKRARRVQNPLPLGTAVPGGLGLGLGIPMLREPGEKFAAESGMPRDAAVRAG